MSILWTHNTILAQKSFLTDLHKDLLKFIIYPKFFKLNPEQIKIIEKKIEEIMSLNNYKELKSLPKYGEKYKKNVFVDLIEHQIIIERNNNINTQEENSEYRDNKLLSTCLNFTLRLESYEQLNNLKVLIWVEIERHLE